MSQAGRIERGDQDLETACGRAGSWQPICHTRWATAQATLADPPELVSLLETCLNEDCRFEVIDAWNDPDVPVQLGLCQTHLPTFGEDCARHTLSRWWRDRPNPDQLKVLQSSTLYPRQVGNYLGFLAACRDLGRCVGAPEVVSGCLEGKGRVAKVGKICSEPALPEFARSRRVPEGWLQPAAETDEASTSP